MSCTFHYKFPLVSLGAPCTYVHDHSRARSRTLPILGPAGIGKKERRIYRGTMASGQGKSECSLTPRSDINSCYSYVYAGRKSKMNGGRSTLSLPFVSFRIFSYDSFLGFCWSIARITKIVLSIITDERVVATIIISKEKMYINRDQRKVLCLFVVTLKKCTIESEDISFRQLSDICETRITKRLP